jgi:3-isopropylmalate/(R)-2-methylmalate dehydratase small subunit
MMVLQGKTWKFGDGISTDHIAPGRYLHLRSNLPELAKHVLEDAKPDFAKEMNKGDFVVAGKNFGLGSSREHAPVIMKIAGINAVLAKSFARIFYRNAINVGLLAVICDTDKIEQGDELEVNVEKGEIRNKSKGIQFSFSSLPPVMRNILNDGGLVAYVNKHGDFKL